MTTQIGWLWPLAIMLLIHSACGDDTAIVVTVDARPEVIGTESLEVTVSNDGDSSSERFPLGSKSFPLTFSITLEGRAGEVIIDVVAVGSDELPRGVGAVAASIEAETQVAATVQLDPADFVVNTSTVGSQKPVFRNARNGRQLAVDPADGSFFVPFVDDCSQSEMECNVYGRLFDGLAVPRVNDTGDNDDEFQINLQDQVFGSVPSIALGDTSSLVCFELFSSVDDDIRAVLLDRSGGHATAAETVVASGAALRPSDPDVAALSGDEYVVVWSQVNGVGREIRGRLIGPDGLPLINAITGDAAEFPISLDVGVNYNNPSVFATGNDRQFVVVWEGDDNVFLKSFDNAGIEQLTGEIPLTVFPAGGTIFGPKVHVDDDGNAVVSWGVHVTGDVDLERGAFQIGKFALPAGGVVVAPFTVAAPLLEVAPGPAEIPPFGAPALSGRTGEIALAWHECLDGDGAKKDCDVFATRYDADLVEVGTPVVVNTTRARNQESVSLEAGPEGYVAVWTDESLAQPDTSLAAVRARLLFFPPPSTSP